MQLFVSFSLPYGAAMNFKVLRDVCSHFVNRSDFFSYLFHGRIL